MTSKLKPGGDLVYSSVALQLMPPDNSKDIHIITHTYILYIHIMHAGGLNVHCQDVTYEQTYLHMSTHPPIIHRTYARLYVYLNTYIDAS